MALSYLPECDLRTTKMVRDINIKAGGEHKPRQNKGEKGDITVVTAI